jgi:hypothetical protein
VLALAVPVLGSLAESRLRLLIVDAGLPRPRVQGWTSRTAGRSGSTAWPELMIGIEYEGDVHTQLGRCCATSVATRLVDRTGGSTGTPSWSVRGEPERIVTELGRARKQRPSGTSGYSLRRNPAQVPFERVPPWRRRLMGL